jgi:hypothetical protein
VGFPASASLSERARDRRAAAQEPAPALRLRSAPPALPPGGGGEVVVELTAGGTWTVAALPPLAGGLSVEPPATRTLTVESRATVTFTVRADRPDTLNGGVPWVLALHASGGRREETLTVAIAVPDPDLVRSVDALDVTDETTARLVAWTAPEPCAADSARRMRRFPVRLLGRGIRVDPAHPAEVTIAPPESLEAAAIARLTVWQGGHALGSGTRALAVTLVDREAPIELEVELASRRPDVPFVRERGEALRSDLFRLRPPRPTGTAGCYRVPPDVVRLLMNPLAGGDEPLGRRMHPLSASGWVRA